MTSSPSFDAAVIGGGAAGLSAAVALGRARRSVVVIDAGSPRNAAADGVHNFLTRDGTPPAELTAIGRDEVARYGGTVRPGRATGARRTEGGFVVDLHDGTSVTARRLVVTSGAVDELPAVPGLADRWGRDVIHCPYCHGYEVADRAIGVIGSGRMTMHQALLFRQWTDNLVVFLLDSAPELTDTEEEQLAARGITVERTPIAGLVVDDDALTGVALTDGRIVARDALVVGPRAVASSPVLDDLGLVTEAFPAGADFGMSYPKVDATGATTVPGVWLAGNVTDLTAQVIGAAAAGTMAGAACNNDLVMEETAAAVTAHRTEQATAFWEQHYGAKDQIWSGRPNLRLVEVAGDLTPGRALDLGCGEGGDAVWLASQGWDVTGVDISSTALARVGRAAESAGVGDRITLERHDLGASVPEGKWDLVNAQFFQSPIEWARADALRQVAARVAPGGHLLLVDHGSAPSWSPHHDHHFPTVAETATELALDPAEWDLVRQDTPTRDVQSPDGEDATIIDNVLLWRRR